MDDRADTPIAVDGASETDADTLAAVDAWGRRAGATLRDRAAVPPLDDVVRRGRRHQQARGALRVGAVALSTAVLIVVVAALRADEDSQPSSPPTPPPTAPAASGLLLHGTPDGDIAGFDVATGASSVVIDGASRDSNPFASPDGTKFLFERVEGSEARALWVADIDGRTRRVLTSAGSLVWIEWSSDSRRVLTIDRSGDATITDVDTSGTAIVDLVDPITRAGWVSRDRLLAVTRSPAGFRYVITDASGDATVELPTAEGAIEQFSIAPDGSRFAYTTWGDDPAEVGRIHLVDLDTETDRVVTPPGDGFEWQAPLFSPDGRWIKLDRYDATDAPLQVVLLPVDDPSAAVLVGPAGQPGSTSAVFSPDSSSLVIRYASGESYLFDLSTRTARSVELPDSGGLLSWLPSAAAESAGS